MTWIGTSSLDNNITVTAQLNLEKMQENYDNNR